MPIGVSANPSIKGTRNVNIKIFDMYLNACSAGTCHFNQGCGCLGGFRL